MKVGIFVDDYKVDEFVSSLEKEGYVIEKFNGLTPDTKQLRIETNTKQLPKLKALLGKLDKKSRRLH